VIKLLGILKERRRKGKARFILLLIRRLGESLAGAAIGRKQWSKEEAEGVTTTICITTLIPRGQEEDLSITLWVGIGKVSRTSTSLRWVLIIGTQHAILNKDFSLP
jgi:hypothetical protein